MGEWGLQEEGRGKKKENNMNNMIEKFDWSKSARKGFLASGLDPADRRGHKNYYIDLLQKMALENVLELRGDELVLDFGCGSGRISYWIAPRVKKVIGIEVTPEMVDLAEQNRTAENVEFILYDGSNFPEFPFKFDLIISIGVLQMMRGEMLKKTIFKLGDYLKERGKGYFIEQVSDNLKIGRPTLEEYLKAFDASGLECLHYYPIRMGRWWTIYLIRYGLIPKKWFSKISHWELSKIRERQRKIKYYYDFLFITKRMGRSERVI